MRLLTLLVAALLIVPALADAGTTCPRCGREWTKALNFCGACGAPLQKGLVGQLQPQPSGEEPTHREDQLARTFFRCLQRGRPYPGAMSSRVGWLQPVMDVKVVKKFRENTPAGQEKYRYAVLVQHRNRDNVWQWVEMVLRLQVEPRERLLLFCRSGHYWGRWRNCMELPVDPSTFR